MDGLFGGDPFRDFGPDGLAGGAPPPPVHVVRAQRAAGLQSQISQMCPSKPGVYGMLDAAGELIYLGKAKRLRDRLMSYFRARSRPPKAGRILRDTRALAWEVSPHEFGALLREQELIRRWRPRYNVQGQPLRRKLAFVCLGRAPAAYVFLTRQPPAAAAAFGPINWTLRTVKAVQRVNDLFRLRDCPQAQEIVFPEQGGLFALARAPGCVRAELATCTAPCTGTLPQANYARQAQAALAFLSGTTTSPLTELERRMHAAAAEQQFERAGIWRDLWADLTWLTEQLARMRHAQESLSFIYPVTGWDNAAHWYLIHGARVLARVAAPSDAATAKQAARAIDAVYSGKRLDQLLTPYEHHDGRLLVMQWFRRDPAQRNKTMPPEQARRVCERCPASKSA